MSTCLLLFLNWLSRCHVDWLKCEVFNVESNTFSSLSLPFSHSPSLSLSLSPSLGFVIEGVGVDSSDEEGEGEEGEGGEDAMDARDDVDDGGSANVDGRSLMRTLQGVRETT